MGIPLPKGEGDAKRRVRGEENYLCTPHPSLECEIYFMRFLTVGRIASAQI